jgi:tetratricopeptide (TPR) repeat protein
MAIFLLLGALFMGSCASVFAQGDGGSAASALESADNAFAAKQYTQAMPLYEEVYAQGKFSELMLYRMAFMHENLRQYPEAIFYLKKAAQEFGDKDTDAKIRQLMQRQGSTRFFTGDTWNVYLTFFRRWGWTVYAAFGIAIAGLAAHYLLRNPHKPIWRQLTMVGAWALLILSGLVLFHRSYLVPDRAVLMEPTAFYAEPGFSASHHFNAFSLGETLDIEDRSDIWIQVSAGGRQWWVPNWVVREL